MAMQKVEITIDEEGIHADPDPLPIPQGEADVRIRWCIAKAQRDWCFTDDGIAIGWNFGQFVEPERWNRREYRWTSRNTNTKLYKYTINVTNGETTASLDPGIKNGGR